MAIAERTDTRLDAFEESPSVPRVLAIVVTHEGRTWLKDCLTALKMQTYEDLDVLVVDDASPSYRQQPHLKRVAKRHLQPRRWGYVRTPRPLGFGGAINWAMSRVRTDADFLLFLHDDAALTPRSVEALVARLVAEPSTGIVGPKVVAWDDPSQLEEVGMAIDRFGYPYKGLEQGEIDLGQHDVSSEVFYVTSTCMLIRHDLFRQLKGWDSSMRAFSEDLDLCWRARLAGHVIRVEPEASARHAIALATGLRRSRFLPVRYFVRRNRLRTIAKNVSGVRLLGLAPQFVLLALMEMIGFVILRQPGQILSLVRALGWNIVRLPQTLSERARAQRLRKVQDRELRRLTVRQSARVRVYIAHQADRLEEAWGRRAEIISQRATRARAMARVLRARNIAIAAAVLITLLVGFRHYLWGPPAVVGELLPFPDRTTGLWRAFLSPWQAVDLGYPGPAPPALAGLGLLPFFSFGAPGVAQKLLVSVLGVLSFVGGYRLLQDVADRPARIAAGAAYAFGALGYAAMRQGALGALVFGAAAPFVLLSLLRLSGWARPATWEGGREIARAALGAAASAAFVPGSLALYAIACVVMSLTRAAFGGRSMRALVACLLPIVIGWALLLPWSLGWWSSGGVLQRVGGDETWRNFAQAFRGHSMASVLTGQTPDGPALAGIALPLLGIVAVWVGEGQRRRIALVLWGALAAVGLVIVGTSSGVFRPLVASPTEAGVIISVAFAGLAGLAVGAFRLDLPRRGLGIVHALTLGSLALAGFLFLAGVVPSMWSGEWAPGGRGGRPRALVAQQIHSLLSSDAVQRPFRTLWVGTEWSSPSSGAFPVGDHSVTGSRGRGLADLFGSTEDHTKEELSNVIASIEEGDTDRGGALLGAFNIQYVVLEPGDRQGPWLDQRDLELIRDEPGFALLRNTVGVARAAVYNEFPVYVNAIEALDPRLSAGRQEIERAELEQASSSKYEAPSAAGPGVIFLAEASDPGWTATVDGGGLERVSGGWGNAFEVPAGAQGRVTVAYPRPLSTVVWFVTVGLAWIVVLGAAFSRRKKTTASTTRRSL